MSEQMNESEAGSTATAPQQPRSRRPVLLAVAATGVVVLAAAVIGRQPWATSQSATGVRTGGSPIAAAVDPALVDLDVGYSYEASTGAATGIVLSPDGEVLTNNHVIDGATRITAVDLGNGRTYTATVVGYEPSIDIAVIQLHGASGLAAARLGDSSTVRVGEPVLGIGDSLGAGGTPPIDHGTVVLLDQPLAATDGSGSMTEVLSGLIETNADIQPGDSGGPLVDPRGRVIGVNTAGSGPGLRSAHSYAVPIDQAISTARQIESGGGSATVHVGPSAFLGVEISPASLNAGPGAGSSQAGLELQSVTSGGAAEKAGLGAGDVLTSLDGRPLGSATALRAILLGHHPLDVVKLGWTDSSGHPHLASVELGNGPPS